MSDQGTKIFVRNLPRRTKAHNLVPLFVEYGEVTDCYVSLRKCYAFVSMATEEEALAAIAGLDETDLMGTNIDVKLSHHNKNIRTYKPDTSLHGRCIKCADGDTIKFLPEDGSSHLKIRFAGLDTPEIAHEPYPGQPYGEEAREHLTSLILDKMVTIKVKSKDQYGRTLGTVFLQEDDEEVNICLKMVEDGYAHVYRGYDGVDEELKRAEDQAREERRGLWDQDDIEIPRRYRGRMREEYPDS